MTGLRIGHGYDVHRLVPGRKLILGGVSVPWELGLDGHSDADVLVHAVMDALLGAAALGDIGVLFPDQDDAFLNISSILLLERVASVLKENGWQVVNVDATLIAQRPKVGPYREAMRQNIAAALQVDLSRVSVKATTEERLGFTGDGSGMAAHAVALIERIEDPAL
jgi:2-C-methyl-D-erythritol 2,4-cyclodiphosphate synthase